jgi:hypothetical protein
MALIDKLQDSNFGLKGSTPEKGKGTDLSSDTHVFDPTPGSQGDEKIMFESVYALPQVPVAYREQSREALSNFQIPDSGVTPD